MPEIARDYTGIDRTVQCDEQGRLVVGIFTSYIKSDADDASPGYIGWLRPDGAWIIQKETISSNLTTFRYACGTHSYTTNWIGRASLTYVLADSAF